jgi:putative holliday junction resolvase
MAGMILALQDLRATVPSGRRLFGLDLGAKTIGIALSDVTWTIASPLETLRRSRFAADAARLLALADRHDAGGLVIGLPVALHGGDSPRAQAARAYARNLLTLRSMPIAFWDERLSTAAIERMLIDEIDASRARRAQIVDKLAAAYILQGALDRLARMRTQP